MTTALAYAFRNPRQELERAVADYLAVSRGSHLYADAEAHALAEQRAWERMMELKARVERGERPAPTPAAAE